MKKPQSWRELLKKVIGDPKEKERIARDLGVSTLTLTRWVNQQSNPRPNNLTKLSNILRPQYSTLFRELIAEEFKDSSPGIFSTREIQSEIPATFYAQLLSELADIPKMQHSWSVCDAVLRQVLQHLDPYHSGMLVAVLRCTPPAPGQKIRSLYTSVRQGTPPWTGNALQQIVFFGAESLAGYTVSTGRCDTIEDCEALDERRLFRAIEGARSLVAYPIKHLGLIAGCLWAASTQPRYFTPERVRLFKNYANLLALAFEPKDFYESGQIALGMMPPTQVQSPHFSTFWPRIAQVVRESIENGEPLSNRGAEQVVLQQLEDELLYLPSSL